MKILIVCLGNICRSPLAHGILQHLADERGLDWEIDSAGIGGWHVGNPPDHRAIAVAKRHGIDISKQRAKQLHHRHLEEFDHILAMDRDNLRHLLAYAKTSEQRARIQLFLGGQEVPDPYYDGRLFDVVYQLVEKRCRELLAIWGK
ncbi:low molecular weight phosphotyrosine protein phosphatase [Parapedobacter sp. ISTM3]|uniref:low molecular weight protein-tyrosine-phosphatase n=1 Tax=Parapedobacter sp. ISTM3 TaxID=2800130 RepID=UPI001906D9DC|nr:low molecular weight protein-tyrosine-phosphatase [Parapedobacter sp. ISTM3]MBK1438390.1 low molecular weight phosphotyrosine protein phosphatase [Parapedobacter sp. ISTM3]